MLESLDGEELGAFKLAVEAERILRLNDRGTHTVPASRLYPFRWKWDSSLIALGWAAIDERRAWTELHASMSSQWQSGMVPHIDFGTDVGSYFPGPAVWQAENGASGITQPPLTGTIALEVYKRARDRDLARDAVRALLPKLTRLHRWLYSVRQIDESGLLACLHPWETGMDDSPAWDLPMDAVTTAKVPPYIRKDTRHVDPSQRPTKTFYDRCYAILLALKEHGYDTREATHSSPFCVADVCFNAIAVRSTADLIELASEVEFDALEAEEWRAAGEAGIATLWSRSLGVFASRDVRSGVISNVATSAGFLPLLTDAPTSNQVQQLGTTLSQWCETVGYGLPSIDPSSGLFDPVRYWRGPVWANVNWQISRGFAKHGCDDLARRLRHDTFRLIQASGCWEYFHPLTGRGLGAEDFSWTAALALGWSERC